MFKYLPNDLLEELVASGKLYKLRRLKGSISYTPSAWIVAERRLKGDSWGFRKAAIGKAGLEQMRALNAPFPKQYITGLLKAVDGDGR